MKRLILAAVLSFGASGTYAQVEQCLDVSNDFDRLDCYDRATGRIMEFQLGRWQISRKTLASTPAQITIATFSVEEVACGMPADPVLFSVICRNGKSTIEFFSRCGVLGADTETGTALQFSGGEYQTANIVSNKYFSSMLAIEDDQQIRKVIDALIQSDRLTIAMNSVSQPQIVNFRTAGLRAAIANSVPNSCGWDIWLN